MVMSAEETDEMMIESGLLLPFEIEGGSQMVRVVKLCDAWFDIVGGACRLRCSTTGVVEGDFRVQISEGVFLLFRHIADIKGQRIFEATGQPWVSDKDNSLPSPLLHLSGPRRTEGID